MMQYRNFSLNSLTAFLTLRNDDKSIESASQVALFRILFIFRIASAAFLEFRQAIITVQP